MNQIFRIFIFIFLIAKATTGIGQSISVKVFDAQNETLIGAQIKLTKFKDSTKVFGGTDKNGIAELKVAANGVYKIMISFVGFQKLFDTINISATNRKFEFHLKTNAVLMNEAVIKGKKPLMRQEDDKTIIDPMPIISSSTNALEVLEKTPGLYVDQDGGIYISSANAAAIYINGREQKMSAADISTLLKSLPPGSIQRIEVMRTPSTKYDASTSGGIINIILQKGVKIGRSGSVSAGMNQGKYSNGFAGFNLNNSGSIGTSYLNLNYNHNGSLEEINSVRLLSMDTAIRQSSLSKQYSEQGYLGYGISIDTWKKSSLNYDGRINMSFPKSDATNNNTIEDSQNLLLAQGNNAINNSSDIISVQQDIGFNRKLDTIGSDWDTKFSYSYNSNANLQDYTTGYSFPFNILVQGNGENKQTRNNFLFQSDLTYKLPLKIKLETGIQINYQQYSSKSDYFLLQNDSNMIDSKRTNAFTYTENINAFYVQASRTFDKFFTLKAGGRIEQTYMKGSQTVPKDTNFIVNRTDWFPYVYLSRKVLRIFGIDLNGYIIYRKTINRPGYQSLNPYIKYIDEFLYETGNPALKPQFTDNYEINVSYDDMPIIAVGQNYTRDVFSSVIYKDPNQGAVAVRTYDNLGKSKETYVRFMVGIPPGGKYFFALGGQYNKNEFDGIYNNEYLKYSRDGWRIFTFHSLNITKETKLTVMGFMMIHGFQNFYELQDFGQLNFGLSQTFFKKKLTVSLSGRDILKTMKTKFSINQGDISTTGDRYMDNQRFGISIRYNFGIKKKDDKKGFMPNEGEE